MAGLEIVMWLFCFSLFAQISNLLAFAVVFWFDFDHIHHSELRYVKSTLGSLTKNTKVPVGPSWKIFFFKISVPMRHSCYLQIILNCFSFSVHPTNWDYEGFPFFFAVAIYCYEVRLVPWYNLERFDFYFKISNCFRVLEWFYLWKFPLQNKSDISLLSKQFFSSTLNSHK